MVIVSHDRELLGMIDQIAELSSGGIRMYGGNLAAYSELLAAEQDAAERAVSAAEADVPRERPPRRRAGQAGPAGPVRQKWPSLERVPRTVDYTRKRRPGIRGRACASCTTTGSIPPGTG